MSALEPAPRRALQLLSQCSFKGIGRAMVLAVFVAAGLWRFADAQPSAVEALPAFAIPADAVFETGDSFRHGGRRYRLFGVQACLRGTAITNERGLKRDCGEVSLAGFAGLARELKASCRPVGQADPETVVIVCAGEVRGRTLDLGIALIAEGLAFATVDTRGEPAHLAYFLAEQEARGARRGLWAYADLPHPREVLRRAR
jgi:endonuclease YncB( thermonuclease family)